MSKREKSTSRTDPPVVAEAPPPPSSTVVRRPSIEYHTVPHRDGAVLAAASKIAPGIATVQNYPKRWLRPDIFAGIAVAAYLVPQVMAYSAIVNVPPVVGLWTALAALVSYAILGAARLLSVGPESTVALMAGTAIAPLVAGDAQRAIALGAALSLLVAAWCFIARLFRLGVIAELLSQPLLIGYLAGGAVLMTVGQLGKLTGTKVGGESIVEQLGSFLHVAGATHLPTLLTGLATLAVLVLIHVVRHRWPAPLIAVSLATVACVLLRLEQEGVAVVGAVPTGLPAPSMPQVSMADLAALVVPALGVAIVAYGDNTLIARGFPPPVQEGESQHHEVVDAQHELVALAGVHVAVGAMGGFPVSSSGSRTALALSSGARSQVYSLVAAACVVVVLFVAGPLVANLPQAALGAVVLYAASKLIQGREIMRLARYNTRELILAVVTAVCTVVFGILAGIGIAMALSFLDLTQRLARPRDGVLGRVDGMAGMHDVADYPEAQTLPGLIVYRYDAPLFFANVADLRRRVLAVVDQENAAFPQTPARWLILNVEANVELDITAADGLRDLHEELATMGVRLGMARVKHDLLIALDKADLLELIGRDMLFPTLPVAEEAYLTWAGANPDVVRVPAEEVPQAPKRVLSWMDMTRDPAGDGVQEEGSERGRSA